MKPRAIICDIDGTLAHMSGRSPYDESKVIEDAVDEVVKGILNLYDPHHKILLVSGRHDTCREDTEKWLLKHNIYYDGLFMRKDDDNRKDDIVKDEIFTNHIKDNYQVVFVLDDRDRVVKMWRDKGLKVLQVAYGNF